VSRSSHRSARASEPTAVDRLVNAARRVKIPKHLTITGCIRAVVSAKTTPGITEGADGTPPHRASRVLTDLLHDVVPVAFPAVQGQENMKEGRCQRLRGSRPPSATQDRNAMRGVSSL